MQNSRPPTIADVARHADVSIATVSRVLNGTTPVQAEKADRVRLAIEELQFVPRQAARVLASKRTNTIGLLLPEISGAFFSPMLKGIEAGTYEAGYDLLIHSTQQVETARRWLGEHNTDGLLIFTHSLASRELQRLHSLNFPVVLLHQTPPDSLNIAVITIENKDGANMLIDHLIERHGRRRIVYLRGPEGHEDSVWRERGYREALEAHNIEFDPDLVSSDGFNDDEALAAIQGLLSDGLDFDAVFAGDDDAAIGAMRALRLAGRLVPQFFANAYDVFLLRQFFMTIPLELDDAARIDGASPLQVLMYIILPQARPALIAVSIFHFLYAWNDFYEPLIYLHSPEHWTLAVGLQTFNALYTVNTNHIMAASVVMILPPIILYFLAQRIFTQGIVFTGIKG